MDPRIKISEHISYQESINSIIALQKDIDNTPSDEILEVMISTAEKLFEPLRNYFNCPIAVTSFFRSLSLNAELVNDPDILASKNSQHCKGEAMDINGRIFGGVSNKQIFLFIRDYLDFDQLIWELGDDQDPAWVHVSTKYIGENRHQILRRKIINGVMQYENL